MTAGQGLRGILASRKPASLQMRDWHPECAPRAMLLAIQIDGDVCQRLRATGIAVHVPLEALDVSLENLSAVALELRKRAPRIPLLLLGPERLLRHFVASYPQLSDGEIYDTNAGDIVNRLEAALRNWPKTN